MKFASPSQYLAEFLGTALIVSGVIGAGYMTRLLDAGQPLGLAMIALTVAAILFVSISILGPISGAHFNPAVSLAFLFRGELPVGKAVGYITSQVFGAVSGAVVSNLMFGESVISVSSVSRMSQGNFLGEIVATWGLVLLILLLVSLERAHLVAAAVAAWIFAGHIFTSSTSFANPAVTLGRIFSEAPSAIAPDSALWFLLAQLIGLGLAIPTFQLLTKKVSN